MKGESTQNATSRRDFLQGTLAVAGTVLAPTFHDRAELTIPRHMQGKSFLPLARQNDSSFSKVWLYEYHEYPNPENVAVQRGIRTERYKRSKGDQPRAVRRQAFYGER